MAVQLHMRMSKRVDTCTANCRQAGTEYVRLFLKSFKLGPGFSEDL